MFNTYDQMQKMVEDKLATVSVNDDLSTFKYARRVMFDNLWSDDNGTMECRGHTYDNTTGQLVVAAPRKSFNYLQNNWGKELTPHSIVHVAKKYNGFLACVSKHNDRVITSTTGSTKSDFVKMAEPLIAQRNWGPPPSHHCTDFFEIIHQDDPHIVDEGGPRAIYLGSRSKTNPSEFMWIGLMEMTFQEALDLAHEDRGEGFMVYANNDKTKPIKLKTPYYTGKKQLMRMNKNKVADMFRSPSSTAQALPVMWGDAPYLIVKEYSVEDWADMDDQQRRAYLEKIEGALCK